LTCICHEEEVVEVENVCDDDDEVVVVVI